MLWLDSYVTLVCNEGCRLIVRVIEKDVKLVRFIFHGTSSYLGWTVFPRANVLVPWTSCWKGILDLMVSRKVGLVG
jgi:hypothetical protein